MIVQVRCPMPPERCDVRCCRLTLRRLSETCDQSLGGPRVRRQFLDYLIERRNELRELFESTDHELA